MKHTYFPGATNALHYLAGGEYTGRCKERGSINEGEVTEGDSREAPLN